MLVMMEWLIRNKTGNKSEEVSLRSCCRRFPTVTTDEVTLRFGLELDRFGFVRVERGRSGRTLTTEKILINTKNLAALPNVTFVAHLLTLDVLNY